MERLNKQYQALISGLITYTDEERTVLDAITTATFFSNVMPIDMDDYSTPAGISKQLDRFVLRHGLLYCAVVKDGQASLERVAVIVPLDRLAPMPRNINS